MTPIRESAGREGYEAFLAAKVALADQAGPDVDPSEVHPLLLPHQRDIVRWAVRGGYRAIFAQFGLGKTVMQLETLRLILEKTPATRALIVCPLGVRREFAHDAGMLGIEVRFVRTDAEASEAGLGILLTNYESVREGKINPAAFDAVSLDEAAILRSFGGTKTFREFMRRFEGSGIYRFVATATPSPNEFIELLSYAAFLGVMEVSEAKTRFFKRDSTKAGRLTLHPHKEQEFWLWCASWAIFLQRPSDLGHSDEGYELPPLDIRWHEVATDHSAAEPERGGQNRLFKNASMGVTAASREKRESLPERIRELMRIRSDDPKAHRVIWHDLEDERRAIEAAIPDAAAVYGSQGLEERERLVADFADGKIPELAAKPVMLGSGTNLQRHCSWAIYLGIGFKFADFIQSLHRLHRFLQTKRVRVDLIYTEAERGIRQELERKWDQHEQLVAEMSKIIRKYGLAQEAVSGALARSIGVDREERSGNGWTLIRNDAVDEIRRTPDDSAGLILTSIPFSTQYEYSPSYNDFGHNEDNAAFWRQMDYLTPELYRALQPGRICAIHVKDRISPSGLTGLGFQVVQPFHAEAIFHYTRHGFGFLGMKTIVTDVVRENNQTYRLGWTEQCKDGTRMGCGMPEYLLIFRKPPTDHADGYADIPVEKEKPLCGDHGEPAPFDPASNWKHPVPGTGYSRGRWQFDAHGFARSSGDRLLSAEELRDLPHEKIYKLWRERSTGAAYDFEGHVGIAEQLDQMRRLPATFMLLPPHSWHPDVWSDVARMRTLNMTQKAKGREMHLCPLQLDIVDRAIVQYTNTGDLVLDPFVGIGTVVVRALRHGRRGLGVELHAGYWADAVAYCQAEDRDVRTPSLFDLDSIPDPSDNEELQHNRRVMAERAERMS